MHLVLLTPNFSNAFSAFSALSAFSAFLGLKPALSRLPVPDQPGGLEQKC